jgi:hypothetical protein
MSYNKDLYFSKNDLTDNNMFAILYLGFSNFFENNNFTFIDNIISKYKK